METLLERLIPLGDLDGNGQAFYLSQFLDWACSSQTEATSEFDIARLDYAAASRNQRTIRQGYVAVPHPDIQAKFRGFARTAQYSILLAKVRDRLVMRDYSVHDLTELFWSIGTLDVVTLSVVDAWLHAADQEQFHAILRLIQVAPHNLPFLFPYFAIHVLHCAD